MKRVLVVGTFGYDKNILDGQTIKTRQTYSLLKDKYNGDVDYICTSAFRNKPWLFLSLIYKVIRCGTIVTLYPSSGGLQNMVPLLYKISRLFRKRLIYIAIGSDQVKLIEGKGIYGLNGVGLKKILINLDGFLAETKKVKTELENKHGFTNVDLFPNFRYFDNNIPFSPASTDILRLVFMARITPDKGYDVAFKFFDSIKEKGLDITLDFYGQMDGTCNDEFLRLVEKHKQQGVRYLGALKPEEIPATLCKYDVMVFPTRVDGIPGSIIDAYISSLTIVATNWVYAHEIIDDEKTGFIVPMENPKKQEQFNERILQLYADRELLNRMKHNAFETRNRYSADVAWNILEKYI